MGTWKSALPAQDVLALPKGTAPTLSIVGFVFDEQPRPPPAKPAPAPAPAPAAQHGKGGASSDGQKDQGTGAGSSGRGQQSESSPSPSPGGEPGQGAREVGVAGPPPHSRGVSGDADSGPDQTASGSRGQGEGREGEEEEDDDEAARRAARRRAGPAMPTAEQLAAAAEAAAFAPPPEEEEEEGGPRFGEGGEGGGQAGWCAAMGRVDGRSGLHALLRYMNAVCCMLRAGAASAPPPNPSQSLGGTQQPLSNVLVLPPVPPTRLPFPIMEFG